MAPFGKVCIRSSLVDISVVNQVINRRKGEEQRKLEGEEENIWRFLCVLMLDPGTFGFVLLHSPTRSDVRCSRNFGSLMPCRGGADQVGRMQVVALTDQS